MRVCRTRLSLRVPRGRGDGWRGVKLACFQTSGGGRGCGVVGGRAGEERGPGLQEAPRGRRVWGWCTRSPAGEHAAGWRHLWVQRP